MPNEMDATELSSVAFSPHGVIYTGTILGKVCAWNTHQRCCFLSWDADCGDIGESAAIPYMVHTKHYRILVQQLAIRNFFWGEQGSCFSAGSG